MTNELSDDLKKQASDLAEAAGERIAGVRDAATAMAEDAGRAIRPAINVARARAERAAGRAQEMADDTYRRGKSAVKDLAANVRGDTLLAIVAAFTVGYSLSLLLHGRK